MNTDVGGSVCTTARAWLARNAVPTAPIKSRRPTTDHAIGILLDVDTKSQAHQSNVYLFDGTARRGTSDSPRRVFPLSDYSGTSVASAVVPLTQSPSDLSFFLLGIAGVEPVGDGLGDADGAAPGGAVGASVASQGLLVLPFAGIARGPVAGNPTGVATLDVIALGRASALSGMAPRATQDVVPMGEQSYFPWTSDLLLRASLWALAAVALPGIAGLVILNAAGVRLSYGPLKPISHDGQPALSDSPDRGPSGLVRSVSFIGIRRRVSRVVRPRRR